MRGKRLISILAESTSVKDIFVCIKGENVGDVYGWDDEKTLIDKKDGTPSLIGFSDGSEGTNEWIIVKG